MTGPQKLIGAGVVTLILMVMGWTGSTLIDLRQSVALVQQEVAHLRGELSQAGSDRYRAADAARDMALRDARLTELERRVTVLEARP